MPRKETIYSHTIEYTNLSGKQCTVDVKITDEIRAYFYNPQWFWRHIDLIVEKDGEQIDKIRLDQ